MPVLGLMHYECLSILISLSSIIKLGGGGVLME